MAKAIYPGSFDPLTNGHLDLIRRAAPLYDELIIAVAVNSSKTSMFSLEERVALIEAEVDQLPSVTVVRFEGLVVELCKKHGAPIILRGIRSYSDFEYELQLAHTNRTLAPGIETVFMLSSVDWSFVSSRLLKEAMSLGADVSHFVTPGVLAAMQGKLG